MIITIDGPAGAGKSSVAKELAKRLKIAYLDTGAMYRALTLKALRRRVDLENEEQLVSLAKQTSIDFSGRIEDGLRVLLDGEDVSEAIRSPDVTNKTFYVARAPGVRAVLVEWQKAMGRKHSLVGEGRDLGTVVFPEARYKFYLDADEEERCRRRIKELKIQKKNIDENEVKNDLIDRDRKDLTRTASPLKKAADAIVIDSTHLSVEQTADVLLTHIPLPARTLPNKLLKAESPHRKRKSTFKN